MQTKTDQNVTVQQDESGPLIVFVDGAGSRLDGSGSGFAWVCTTTKQNKVERVPNLTNNQAEYRAFIAALETFPNGTALKVFSDSELLCRQFHKTCAVNDPTLASLLDEAHALIEGKGLSVILEWVPRTRNLAGKILEQR